MAKHPPNFTPARRPGQAPKTREVFEFLQSSDKLSALLPAAQRVGQLQADCEQLLPTLFANCRALQIHENQLQVAVPNAALATRLRHVLPKLQEGLREKGWALDGIKLKVQPMSADAQRPQRQQEIHELPRNAVNSFAELATAMDQGPLRDALMALVSRRKA
jgi:hypothetical protein